MLHRAASNAYSWWWASHIQTKQSKWLEQNLQDMEEKVQNVLKLIEEDGDSFAKRAEMYYEKRPELIHFVEESYRAYRALAERYDHMSKELQNANNTLATVFPERAQMPIDEEEENAASKFPTKKKLQAKTSSKPTNPAPKSGLSKSEAVQEIDKLQKEILALQTVKEFVKSSYESSLAKYWEIETRVTELREKIVGLEEEFKVGKAIEDDDEARALTAEAALKLCEETLAMLEEKQERSEEEAKVEYQRVEDAREKLNSLRQKFLPRRTDKEKESLKGGEKPRGLEAEAEAEAGREMDELHEKIAKHFDVGSKESGNVMELAEKIDELVSKVISLETSVASQPGLIDKLREETDDLQSQIQTLEDDKVNLIDGTSVLTNKLREMEEKYEKLQDLNRSLESQNHNLQANFTEARCSLDHLSEYMESTIDCESYAGIGSPEELEKREDFMNSRESKAPVGEHKIEQYSESDVFSVKREDPNSLEKVEKQGMHETEEAVVINNEPWGEAKKKADEMNWREMLLNGVEDRETVLLTEYITILRNYKDLRKKLTDVERKNRDRIFETTVQLRQLRSVIAKRDKEIQALRWKFKEDNRDAVEMHHEEEEEEEEDVKLVLIDQPRSISPMEEKLRMNIDALLDENLDFWLRFSTSFHQVQKFETGFQDLQAEISKIKGNNKLSREGGVGELEIKSELRPIYKHLLDIRSGVTIWIDQSAVLKDELQRRFTSLCDIEEEITNALKVGAEEEEMRFTSHEAAMFQGEVSNMKQENNKVRDELEAGLEHVTALRCEIAKTIGKLSEEFGLSGLKSGKESELRRVRVRVPLRAFIFGDNKGKKKSSIFSFMHHRRSSSGN